MKKILFTLTFSCREATMIMEKKTSVGLSRKEAFKLRLHNSVCAYCRYYEKQSILLDKLLQRFSEQTGKTTDNEKLKATILRKLNDQ